MTTLLHSSLPNPLTFLYNRYGNPSLGVSQDAAYIDEGVRQLTNSQTDQMTVISRQIEMLSALTKAMKETVEDDWDGYGAEAFSIESSDIAKQLISLISILPAHLSLPSIAVEPDGEVALTWQTAADRIFSVSVGDYGRLAYSGRVGVHEVEGSVFFAGKLPAAVLREVYAVG